MIEFITFRSATRNDIPEIVRMLADDELGRQRERYENPLPDSYYAAFDQINGNPYFELIVAEMDGRLVGTLQLIFIPSISFQGGLRAQVESVRVDETLRGRGMGYGTGARTRRACRSIDNPQHPRQRPSFLRTAGF
jgi:N-acetylglutamate synthase-like GNAT family acetyltransferase